MFLNYLRNRELNSPTPNPNPKNKPKPNPTLNPNLNQNPNQNPNLIPIPNRNSNSNPNPNRPAVYRCSVNCTLAQFLDKYLPSLPGVYGVQSQILSWLSSVKV